ncbi:MAG: OmpH family outer membrane protein [Saprospiraceae bacterium]|jgi:outer membrane protein
MKKLLNISLLLSFLAVTATNLQAQKFGYLNSGSILAAMPGVEDSDQALKVYQDSLVTIGEEKAAALKTEFEAFAVEYQGGNVPPIKAQQKQEEFQKREQELVQYEQVIYNLVNERRQKLLEPLIGKLQEAIDAVGKEGGYTMIFEIGSSASGFSAILFAPEADDVSALVKAKLGM